MNARLQSIVIPAERFEETVTFYRDLLGLPVSFEGTGFCFLRAGDVSLAIHPVAFDSRYAPTGRCIYFDFLVDDLSAARHKLARAGAAVEREWEDADRRYLLIHDPNGNLVELIEPKPAKA